MKEEAYFKGKVVWVTGASSGIGEALAYRLDRAGSRLILSSNEPEPLEQVWRNCSNRSEHMVLPLDLGEWRNLKGKAAVVLERYDHVDILINNGGISHRDLAKNTLLDVDLKVMEVDYLGHVALTKAVLPSMLARKQGHIVVTSSVMGVMAAPWRSAYCAAKHALHGFFDGLRAEVWQDNIKITLVCPSAVRTNITVTALTGNGERYGKMDNVIASGISPDECAAAYLEAVRKEKREAFVGKGLPRYGVYLRRYLPALYFRLLKDAKVI